MSHGIRASPFPASMIRMRSMRAHVVAFMLGELGRLHKYRAGSIATPTAAIKASASSSHPAAPGGARQLPQASALRSALSVHAPSSLRNRHKLAYVVGVVVGHEQCLERIVWPRPWESVRRGRSWGRRPDPSWPSGRRERPPRNGPGGFIGRGVALGPIAFGELWRDMMRVCGKLQDVPWRSRMCSSRRQGVCGRPGSLRPCFSTGRLAMVVSKSGWACPPRRSSTRCSPQFVVHHSGLPSVCFLNRRRP